MTSRIRHAPTVRVTAERGADSDLAGRLADVVLAAVRAATKDDHEPDVSPPPAQQSAGLPS